MYKGNKEYKFWLVEKNNTFNTFKATIFAKEDFTKEEAKKDMMREFGIEDDINNFKFSIEEI